LTAKDSQLATESGQVGDLSYDEWVKVLTEAMSEAGPDGCFSKAELLPHWRKKTGLGLWALERRLEYLIDTGKVSVERHYRKGRCIQQMVIVYKLKKA